MFWLITHTNIKSFLLKQWKCFLMLCIGSCLYEKYSSSCFFNLDANRAVVREREHHTMLFLGLCVHSVQYFYS